jgi:hypothetical protein
MDIPAMRLLHGFGMRQAHGVARIANSRFTGGAVRVVLVHHLIRLSLAEGRIFMAAGPRHDKRSGDWQSKKGT